MSDYANEICLLGLSAVILAIPSGHPLVITGFLAAIVMACASSLRASIGIAVQIAYLACACLLSAFLAFLPVTTYYLMRARSWAVRLLWIVPLAIWVLLDWKTLEGIQLMALCAVGCVLAVSDGRIASERKGLTHAYDSLRERMVTLQESPKGDALDGEHHERLTTLFEDLSPRESAVAQLVAEGLDNREISQRLFLSEGTVRNYISSILSKKGLENRTQIAIMYYTG